MHPVSKSHFPPHRRLGSTTVGSINTTNMSCANGRSRMTEWQRNQEGLRSHRMNAKMEDSTLDEILHRVDQRQKELKRRRRSGRFSDRAVSIAAGVSPDYLRSLRRQHVQGQQKGITTPVLEGLARALHTTSEWLLKGIGKEETGSAVPSLRIPMRQTELHISWSVRKVDQSYFVDERFEDRIGHWGPVPSEEFAYALIEDRKGAIRKALPGLTAP